MLGVGPDVVWSLLRVEPAKMAISQEIVTKSVDIETRIGIHNTLPDLVPFTIEPECIEKEYRVIDLVACTCLALGTLPDRTFEHRRNLFIPHYLPIRSMGCLHKRIQALHALLVIKNTVTDKNGGGGHTVHDFCSFSLITKGYCQNPELPSKTGL